MKGGGDWPILFALIEHAAHWCLFALRCWAPSSGEVL